MDIAAFVLAIISLLLTLYFQYWQPGKLILFTPQKYYPFDTYNAPGIQILFDFYNDGTKPIIIQDLHLVFLNDNRLPLDFMGIATKICSPCDRRNKKPFTLEAKRTIQLVCEFEGPKFDSVNDSKSDFDYYINNPLGLRAKLGNYNKWKNISQFTLEKKARVMGSTIVIVDDPFD